MKNYQEWIGWVSSVILVLTFVKQVIKQYKTHQSKGVSVWMYVGQLTAQTGFVTYSVLVKNLVFIVTNSILLVVSLLGLTLVLKHRREN